MCYTLNIEESGGNNLIHLFLNTNLTFIVFIHDPKYFIYSSNPQTLPITTWIIPKMNTFTQLSLVEREHTELNVPADPCEENTDYSFTACVKTSLARIVGCWTKWFMHTDDNSLPLCGNISQFRYVEYTE